MGASGTDQLYLKKTKPEDDIASAIELANMADICGIYGDGIKETAAARIKYVINERNPLLPSQYNLGGCEYNTKFLTSEHIISSCELPDGHPVRTVLASAFVSEYLGKWGQGKPTFLEEVKPLPSFGFDVLLEVRKVLANLSNTVDYTGFLFQDPITGKHERMSFKK
ncbi:hypothetical protein B0J14DRAFT_668870 [Halenospora varia]|nr:hypothetical protein B0J14DRAFT_668870 [Halenospora varia]